MVCCASVCDQRLWVLRDVISLVSTELLSSRLALKAIDVSELVVTLVLLFEICFRLVADWRKFFLSRRNCVDLGLAVITSIIQIPVIRNSGQPYAWLTIFQILRIYRVVLAISWTRELIVRI